MRIFVPLLVAATAVSAGSPVQKVIQLIGELQGKVQKNLDAESKAMDEYSSFCDDESTEKNYAIKDAGKAINGYSAVIEDTTGQNQEMASEIESSGSEASSKESELKSATDVRENENADFKAAEKELVEAVDTLGRAVVIIKRELSFVQTGKSNNVNVAKKLAALSGALSTVIEASWMPEASRSKMEAFMSTSTEADEELSLHQPQASVKAYESKSGGIVETLEDMKDKAETALNNLRRDETKARHAFEMIHQSLSDAVSNLNKEIAEATANKASAGEKLAKAQGDLATTEAAKAADEKYVTKLKAECASKASEWEERQKSASDEMAALAKGKEILSAKFGFIQTAVKKATNKDDNYDSRDRVLALLRKMGRNYNSYAMMQIANAATSDPFVKIRGMIESMIAKLQKQGQEEATHESFCQEETAKTMKARETKQASVDKYQARIDGAKAGIAEMQQEVTTLTGEVSDIDKSNREAMSMRNTENGDYKTASSDYKEAAEAVTQALVVLKDFYRGASFVQQPSFDSSRGDAGHAIIEILETAASDFSRLLSEEEAGESESSNAHKSLLQDNKVAKSSKQASIKAKTSEIKSVEVALTHHSEDMATTNKELDAVLEYAAKLKPQCESRAMTFEERKARREAEIGGLKDALSILDDSTSLIQTKGFLSKN